MPNRKSYKKRKRSYKKKGGYKKDVLIMTPGKNNGLHISISADDTLDDIIKKFLKKQGLMPSEDSRYYSLVLGGKRLENYVKGKIGEEILKGVDRLHLIIKQNAIVNKNVSNKNTSKISRSMKRINKEIEDLSKNKYDVDFNNGILNVRLKDDWGGDHMISFDILKDYPFKAPSITIDGGSIPISVIMKWSPQTRIEELLINIKSLLNNYEIAEKSAIVYNDNKSMVSQKLGGRRKNRSRKKTKRKSRKRSRKRTKRKSRKTRKRTKRKTRKSRKSRRRTKRKSRKRSKRKSRKRTRK